MSSTVCAGTPGITVRDNRGLAVRTLRYNRSRPGEVVTQCIERNTFNDLGQPLTSQDARFFGTGTLNFQYSPALSGQVLQTVSADAGQTQTFHDIAGRPIWQRDARDTIQTYTYDALGRPLSRTETLEGQAPAVRERWVYGDATPPERGCDQTDPTDPRNSNLRGQVIQHYDAAGLLDASEVGYTVQGAPQRQDRSLLPPETASDWTSNNPADREAELETETYSTTWTYNAVGQVLEQTDARGHRQSTTHDIAGRKATGSVTPKGGKPTPVTTAITYAAGGQIETKIDANGVTTSYTYEPQTTQRVLGIKVSRAAPAAVLQDLVYTYDPVGNVVNLTDNAAQTAYFNNGSITAARAYTYDALYQLISAKGRENAVGTPSGTDSPSAFAPPDSANYRAYTRTYDYDTGGNLIHIRSTAGTGTAPPTRTMHVAAGSNRSVSDANPIIYSSTLDPESIGSTYFDAAGNANCLDGNTLQPLVWTGLNQLQQLVTFYRNADLSQSDRERYVYGGDGQRVRKTAHALTGGQMKQTTDAIYLPGLEVRANGVTGEQLEVIVLDDGARVLNWPSGDQDTNPPQLRYQICERQGSCQLELDAAGQIITQEEYYPYGGTAVWASRSTSEVTYKTIRYSGKERDAAGLYYYGFRYYQPWIGRWVSADPAGTVDGLNLYCMVRNSPVTESDSLGLMGDCIDRSQRANDLAKNDAVETTRQNAPHNSGLMNSDLSIPPSVGRKARKKPALPPINVVPVGAPSSRGVSELRSESKVVWLRERSELAVIGNDAQSFRRLEEAIERIASTNIGAQLLSAVDAGATRIQNRSLAGTQATPAIVLDLASSYLGVDPMSSIDASNGKGTGSIVHSNLSVADFLRTTSKINRVDLDAIAYFHELVHVHHNLNGERIVIHSTNGEGPSIERLLLEEARTVGLGRKFSASDLTENRFRAEIGVPDRESYGGSASVFHNDDTLVGIEGDLSATFLFRPAGEGELLLRRQR